MKQQKIITIIAALFLFIINGTAQNLDTDLQKMRTIYSKAKSLQIDVDVSIYESGRLQVKKNAAVRQADNNYFYSLDDMTVLLNEEYTMLINQTEKIIVFGKQEEANADLYKAVNQFKIDQMDSLFQQNPKWEFVDNKNKQIHYQLKHKGAMIDQTELYLNADNYTLEKVVFYYDYENDGSKNRVVIDYKNTKVDERIAIEIFSEKKYITRQNGKWKTTTAYKDFDLVDISEDEG